MAQLDNLVRATRGLRLVVSALIALIGGPLPTAQARSQYSVPVYNLEVVLAHAYSCGRFKTTGHNLSERWTIDGTTLGATSLGHAGKMKVYNLSDGVHSLVVPDPENDFKHVDHQVYVLQGKKGVRFLGVLKPETVFSESGLPHLAFMGARLNQGDFPKNLVALTHYLNLELARGATAAWSYPGLEAAEHSALTDSPRDGNIITLENTNEQMVTPEHLHVLEQALERFQDEDAPPPLSGIFFDTDNDTNVIMMIPVRRDSAHERSFRFWHDLLIAVDGIVEGVEGDQVFPSLSSHP